MKKYEFSSLSFGYILGFERRNGRNPKCKKLNKEQKIYVFDKNKDLGVCTILSVQQLPYRLLFKTLSNEEYTLEFPRSPKVKDYYDGWRKTLELYDSSGKEHACTIWYDDSPFTGKFNGFAMNIYCPYCKDYWKLEKRLFTKTNQDTGFCEFCKLTFTIIDKQPQWKKPTGLLAYIHRLIIHTLFT